ncbi:MAG TPA: RNA 2',3'-cyclic phosphodiesterase [Longimicrobiales bacterium]|nr:RNA 2',3'-cyclic phosphodiesterase [Longimicrobiales bacterium]
MRLFIALNLPKKERVRIYRAARPLREAGLPVRWIEPDNFHVTMKFLGEVRREQISRVEELMARVAGSTKAFSTKFAGFGAFPTVRAPRVIWLGILAIPELRCLKQDLEWTLGEIGFDPETRAFHPHVTLGRASERDGGGAFRGFDELLAGMKYRGEVKVHTLDLMRSHVSRDGMRYSILASARLAS